MNAPPTPRLRRLIVFRRLVLLSVLLPILAATPLQAQVQLVEDINPGPEGSFPQNSAILDGVLYFIAYDSEHGPELWQSDGTEAGTVLLKDINPGPDGIGPTYFTELDGVLYFPANDGQHGQEPWRTDGTAEGTYLLKDINPGAERSSPHRYTEFDGALYFSADDGEHGDELWRTNGTEQGTVMVKDVHDGPESGYPSGFTAFDGALYFASYDGEHGREFWRTDGTEEGTVLVVDIRPGSEDGDPFHFTLLDGALYFSAADGYKAGEHGRELWMSDGTEAGTVLLKDINPGIASSSPASWKAFDGALYFTAYHETYGRELWKSDGTEAGTVLVKDIYPEPHDPGFTHYHTGFTAFDGALYFGVNDLEHGVEPWRTDGTTGGTLLLKDINSGSNSGLPIGTGTYIEFVEFDGALYFGAGDGAAHGLELWQTDGTEGGTVLVADINPDGSSGPTDLTAFDGALYFAADDGTYGSELWRLGEVGTPIDTGPGASSLTLTAAPNPTRGRVVLRLTLDRPSPLTVTAYDLLGRRVAVLHEGLLGAGEHTLTLNAAALPGGVYLLRAAAGAEVAAQRVTVVR